MVNKTEINFRPIFQKDITSIWHLIIELGWEDYVGNEERFSKIINNSDRTVVGFDNSKVVGFANDPSPIGRLITYLGATKVIIGATVASFGAGSSASYFEKRVAKMELDYRDAIAARRFPYEEKQQIYEVEKLYREILSVCFEVENRATNYQRSNEALRNVLRAPGEPHPG